jgi:XTP/dITP diphosphohydrolase
MTIWFATGNIHKQKELSAILGDHTLMIPSSAGIEDFDPPEEGASFPENALAKARTLRGLLAERGIPGPVIADDSGLCVDALGGRPGIYSARYAGKGPPAATGKGLSDGERNRLLLAELGDAACRRARFVCAMVLLLGEDRFCAVQETLEGELVRDLSLAAGSGGFGYDPILYIPQDRRTVAELPEAEKNRISHRGRAGRAMAAFLAALSGEPQEFVALRG